MGIANIFGKVAKVGGAGLSLAGLPRIGVPLAVAGGVLEGGSRGGVAGAAKGAGVAGVQQFIGGGAGNLLHSLKTPVDLGPMTGFSAGGSPLTIPGVRKNPILTYSAQGSPTTTPASPTEFMGGS
jgi:hypothetical protein